MRAMIAATVALSLSAATLAGCGQTPLPAPGASSVAGLQASSSRQASSTQLARAFFDRLQPHYRTGIARIGSTVTIGLDETRTAYNFADTPTTGQVKVTSGEYTFEIAYAKLMESTKSGEMGQDVLPAMLVPIAIQVGLGGALGVANYWLTHRGEKFKRDEAIKAAVEGMLVALIPITREMKYVRFLTPLAVALVKSAKTLHYKDLAEAAMKNVENIVKVLIAIIQDMQTSPDDRAVATAKG